MSTPAIEIKQLYHAYGSKEIYADLNLEIQTGTVFGLLGKNGVGKSTLINILMGYIRPQQGECLILGESSYCLPPETRERIALLYEGFTSYDTMSVTQVERFFSSFYPKWDRKVFFELIDLMDLSLTQKLSSLSFGQKSQVVLGLLFAQDADLLILDDYSMGLDAGYRRLFVDYLKDYLYGTEKTVLITSHVMNDLENLVDEIAIVDRSTDVYQNSMAGFCRGFRCYECTEAPAASDKVHRFETHKTGHQLFSFFDREELEREIGQPLTEVQVNFEEKFLGFVGKY